MSDNIFISWSKSKSREFAFEVKNLLETLNPHLNIFMSEDNISAGEKVQEKIIQKISECDKVLLCFTRDNKKSPCTMVIHLSRLMFRDFLTGSGHLTFAFK